MAADEPEAESTDNAPILSGRRRKKVRAPLARPPRTLADPWPRSHFYPLPELAFLLFPVPARTRTPLPTTHVNHIHAKPAFNTKSPIVSSEKNCRGLRRYG